MIYLYIFGDGSVRQSLNAPTEEDFSSIADGILSVFQIDGSIQEFCDDGTLSDVLDIAAW